MSWNTTTSFKFSSTTDLTVIFISFLLFFFLRAAHLPALLAFSNADQPDEDGGWSAGY
jgi:hypothetical protein